MKKVTQEEVIRFWGRVVESGDLRYFDSAGELNLTLMGEEAAEYFGVKSEDGYTDIEEQIFEWTIEFKPDQYLPHTKNRGRHQ